MLWINSHSTDNMENPAESNTNLNGEGDDEGNLLIDEGADVVGVGGLVPPELVDIAVALNEDRVWTDFFVDKTLHA